MAARAPAGTETEISATPSQIIVSSTLSVSSAEAVRAVQAPSSIWITTTEPADVAGDTSPDPRMTLSVAQ